jgi:transcriptional regulator with XRE-family HTH domain
MQKQTIAERLKEARTRAKLSLPEVNEKTGISTGNLSELEKGKHDPSAKALVLFSEIYHVSIDWLLTGKTFEDGNKSLDSANELKQILNSIDGLWEKADEQTRGWIIVQLKRAFPELAEQSKK